MDNFVINEQVFPAHSKEHLGYGDNVFFAVGHDAVNVVLHMEHMPHLAAVDVTFGRGNAQYLGEQFERGKAFVIAKLPQFHGVKVRHFPRLFAKEVELGRYGQVVDDHPAGNVGKVKFLGIVPAHNVLRLAKVVVEQVAEILQYLDLLTAKRGNAKMPYIAPEGKIPGRQAHDLAKLGPDACALIKILGRAAVLTLVTRLQIIQQLCLLVQVPEVRMLRHRLYIEEQYIFKVYFLYHF